MEEIVPGHEYLAYCGSLARVQVLETGLVYQDAVQSRKRNGVKVRATEDVPWAIDINLARAQERPVKLVHRQGDEFMVRSRDVDRPVCEGPA
jgi:hypothetical protein